MTNLRLILVISLLLPLLVTGSDYGIDIPVVQSGNDPEVEALMAQMDPTERVGQLFLVTFTGSEAGSDSEIATLITDYHIGGVVLLAENGNITGEVNVPQQVYNLTAQLQGLAAGNYGSEAVAPPPGDSFANGPYVPLFIGIEHDGSGWPHQQLLSGMTPLPSSMALGATWDPALAERTGVVVGQELSALGINLLLGPSADVVELPQPSTTGDLGTWVYGGEPFWVSQMTAAYVRGVHVGSEGRIAVVPRHFPGHGGADRLASVEVPTVRRSLEQLTQFDLSPFYAVTGAASDDLSVADGLMTGHIRYLGFQGDNPRFATRPISLDSLALPVLIRLEPISAWRSDGGLMVTDALGLQGVRRFYDPQGTSFPNRRIAQDALLAGNDVLYLGNFGSDTESSQALIIDTIEFFIQAYNENPAFQARVDDAVRRILRKKLDLYGSFDQQANVIPSASEMTLLGSRSEVTLQTAQAALTLLSPGQSELLASPQSTDQIVIFTDTRAVRQCGACLAEPVIESHALEEAILRAYGPQASALTNSSNIRSFSFEQLADYLQFGPQVAPSEQDATAEPDELAIALANADWVVFVMLDIDPDVSASDVVKRFLSVQSSGGDTQLVVMAMDAPYYLDSTEISKLTAYFGLYGHTQPFIDVAARALFLGEAMNGASPVSVSGIDYNILQATSPDPRQVIRLMFDQPAEQGTHAATPSTPVLQRGDSVQLVTGVIVDHNLRPVPDGTPVDFVISYVNEGLRNVLPATTVGGIARASIVLDRPGALQITVQSNLARSSDSIQIVVPDTGSAIIDVVPPELTPIPTPQATEPPAAPDGAGAPPLEDPTQMGTIQPNRVDFADLLLSVLGLLCIASVTFYLGFRRRDTNYGLLLALPVTISGLMAYNWFVLVAPPQASTGDAGSGIWNAVTVTLAGGLIGLVSVRLFLYLRTRWSTIALPGRRRK